MSKIVEFDPQPATSQPTTPADELKALARIVTILEKLDPGSQDRCAGWIHNRYRHETEAH